MKIKYRLLGPKDKGQYLNLVSVFGEVDLNQVQWEAWYETYADSDKEIILGIVDDVNLGELVVCTASLLYEEKAFHNMSKAAHLEDVVVLEKYRGLGIGKALVNHLISVAKETGCYKILLSCKEENMLFYSKLGFVQHENSMRLSI